MPALPSALAVPLPQAKRFKPEEGRAVETMIPLRLRFPQASTFLTLGLNMRGELARLCLHSQIVRYIARYIHRLWWQLCS